jgi:hypothetical protein
MHVCTVCVHVFRFPSLLLTRPDAAATSLVSRWLFRTPTTRYNTWLLGACRCWPGFVKA